LTKDLLVEYTKFDGLEKTLSVQLHRAPKVKILNQMKIETMTDHLRTENTYIELGIVSYHSCRSRTNETHKVQKDLSKWTSLTLSLLLCDTVNINRTLTDLEIIWIYDGVKSIHEATT
jgi:hypothetical protein